MPTSPYLLHVNSRPTGSGVSDAIWTEWYTTEHIPDLVNHKASNRATFYKEVPAPDAPETNPRHFLALYQSASEEPLKTEGYLNGVRHGSGLFEKASGKADTMENGDFDARNYALIQDYDPNGIGDATSPVIVTVEMNARNADDFHKWYKEEHLDLLSKLPGYRKSTRYALGPATPLTHGTPAKFLAIHELERLDGLAGPEATAANETEWTVRMIKESDPFIVRMWSLVHREGDWK